jgi:hypothetical protein
VGETTDSASRARGSSQDPTDAGHPAPAAPQGGQFALGGGRVEGKPKPGKGGHHNAAKPAAHKPTGPRRFGYDPKHNTGVGYGVKGGDPDVRILQAAANRLGVLDMHGQQLAVDGRYGPRTTSVVEAIQRRLGQPVTGQVDENTIKAIAALKSLPTAAQKPTRKAPVKRAMAMDMASEQPDVTMQLQDLLASLDDEDLNELVALAEAMHNEPGGE